MSTAMWNLFTNGTKNLKVSKHKSQIPIASIAGQSFGIWDFSFAIYAARRLVRLQPIFSHPQINFQRHSKFISVFHFVLYHVF